MTKLAHRSKKPYVTAPWETAKDPRLSFAARGLLIYLLSQSDGWRVDVAAIRRANAGADKDDPRTSNNEGREAIEKALRTLRRYGYYRVVTFKNPDGSFANKGWISEEAVPEWADEYARHPERPPFIAGYDGSDPSVEPPILPENPQVSRTHGFPGVRDDEGARTYGIPGAGDPGAGDPGFIEQQRENNREREEPSLRSGSSSDDSLRSSSARPAETPSSDEPALLPAPVAASEPTPMQRAEAIAKAWVKRRRDQNIPVPNARQVHMGVRGYVKAALEEGVSEAQVKSALDRAGETLPSMPVWRRALEEVVTGRTHVPPWQRGQMPYRDAPGVNDVDMRELFGLGKGGAQ